MAVINFNRKRSAADYLNSPNSDSPPIEHVHVSKKAKLGGFVGGLLDIRNAPARICDRIGSFLGLQRTYEAAKGVALGSLRFLGQVMLGKDENKEGEVIQIRDGGDRNEARKVVQVGVEGVEEVKEVFHFDDGGDRNEARKVVQVGVEGVEEVKKVFHFDDGGDHKEAKKAIQIGVEGVEEVRRVFHIDDVGGVEEAKKAIQIDVEDVEEVKKVFHFDDGGDHKEAKKAIQIDVEDVEEVKKVFHVDDGGGGEGAKEVIQIDSDDDDVEEVKEVIQDYMPAVDIFDGLSFEEANEVMQVDSYDDHDVEQEWDLIQMDDGEQEWEQLIQIAGGEQEWEEVIQIDGGEQDEWEEVIQIDGDEQEWEDLIQIYDGEQEAEELIQIDGGEQEAEELIQIDDGGEQEAEELIQIDDSDEQEWEELIQIDGGEQEAEELIQIDDDDEQEAEELTQIDDDDEQEAEKVVQIDDNDEDYMPVVDGLRSSVEEVDVSVQKDVGVHGVVRLDKELQSLGSHVVSDVSNAVEKDVGIHGVIRLDKELGSLDSPVPPNNESNVVKKDVASLGVIGLDKELRSLASPAVLDVGNVADKMAYMKLYESTRRRDCKLKMLDFEIKLKETLRQRFNSLWPQTKPKDVKMDTAKECFTPATEEEEKKVHEASAEDYFTLLTEEEEIEVLEASADEECFIPLTEEEEMEVHDAFSNPNVLKILVSHQSSNIEITAEKFRCLMSHGLLNDEVINLYLELLKEREKRNPQKLLKCHFFNTFFYKKLLSKGDYNYQQVRRWTTKRKLGYSLMDCDKIFVPIHQNAHWTLAIINKKERKFQYLDSLGGFRCLDVLRRYYVDEVKDKSGKVIDVSSWEVEHVRDAPQQDNGFDCGMFMIKYVDFHSRDLGLCFGQEHMPYFRWRTAKELLRLRAE